MEGNLPDGDQINVYNPEGNLVSIPKAMLPAASSQGYTVPEGLGLPDDTSLGEKLFTGLEGAGIGTTFGASTLLEKGLSKIGVPGLSDEEINARRENNPLSHAIGEGVGLVGSSLAGGLAAKAATKLAQAGLEASAGLGAAQLGAGHLAEELGAKGAGALFGIAKEGQELSTAARIGSSAVNNAIQFGLVQSGDEVSKLLTAENPSEGVGSALLNIGLASAFGGALGTGFGAVSPLWKNVSEGSLSNTLKMMSEKAGGQEVVSNPISQAIETSGIQVAPEVTAALSNNPVLRDAANVLRQSDTSAAGIHFQEAEKLFREEASSELASGVRGRPVSAEELKSASEFSLADEGHNLGKAVAKELEDKVGPIAQEFEILRAKNANVELKPDVQIPDPQNPYQMIEKAGTASKIQENLATLAQKEGWNTFTDSEIMRALNKVSKNVDSLKTLGDLDRFITQVGNETYDFTNPSLSRAGMLMKGVLRDAHAELVVEKLGAEGGAEAVASHQAARQAWSEASALKDQLQDRLKIKSGDSLGSFIKALKEEAEENGEKIANRLSGKNNAGTLQLLAEQFPQTAQLLKDFHQNQLLKGSVEKGLGGELQLNSGSLLRNLKKMSPELKEFTIGSAGVQKVEAIDTLLNQLHNPKHNFSNTARTLTSLSKHLPAGVGAMAGMLLGHNPIMGLILGELAQHVGTNVPDAVRLGLLKFMGTAKPIEAEGFKTTVDFISHMIKGENQIGKAVKTVFKSGAEVLPQLNLPSAEEKKKLEKQVEKLQEKPEALMNIGGKTNYYLENHASSLAQQSMQAFQYLKQVKPNPQKASPLDPTPEVAPSEKYAYDRALQIAIRPLSLLKDVKEGSLTPTDLQHLNALHPAVYNNMKQKLVNDMTDHLTEGHTIPYKTRMGLSLFLGEPLDSTLKPMSIQATQSTFMQNHSPTQQAPDARGGRAHSLKALGKIGASEQLPSQERLQDRSQK